METRTYSDFLSILKRSTESISEDPVREELFSVERLEQYAAYLASELRISSDPKKGRSLVPELKECGVKLLEAYLLVADAIRNKQPVSPAAEWFVDNFHIVEDQLRDIKRDLPANYYHELPKLAAGELKGYPRVYAMALAMIAHTDSRLDAETLKRFLRAFQEVAPLRIGELWAVAITLRIALVEQLKLLAERVVSARKSRAAADELADQLLELAAQNPGSPAVLIEVLKERMGAADSYDRAFIVQLTQRLRDQDPDVWPALDWLEKQLNEQKTHTLQVIQFEHHRQAAAQVTVGNIISSMRLLSALDWREFFESVSLVDPILMGDPAGAYAEMDFATRDRYRHEIERIAKRSNVSELEVARRAVELCAKAKQASHSKEKNLDPRRFHVGFYLSDEGMVEFEGLFNYQPPFREKIHRKVLRHPTRFFLGSLGLFTLVLLAPLLAYFLLAGGAWVALLFFGILVSIPASDFALNALNQLITHSVHPKLLPKMDMEDGVPADARTFVVIPTLFTSLDSVQELLDRLEVHYLANQDPNIQFALLSDFADASAQTLPADAELLRAAQTGIAELNLRYSSENAERHFYLFHRRRLWNPSENAWIGWERKRGKLLEFNRLLRGATDTSYLPQDADPKILAQVQYVITLDSDTQLPRDTARRLIGTITHPLNRPRYNPEKRRVTEGYGILQPRVSVSLLSATRSRFARVYSGNTGLDPYTTAVSDVYQDLFGEGSFTGKGLYVVDAFEKALENRVPENAVLSHDLFEGSYARSALVTDIEFFDDYPSDYDTFAKRAHRWTRGDWQITQWLLPWVPDSRGKLVANHLSLISKWKIFDNLRRSLIAPAVLTWLVLAWTVLSGSPLIWTALVVGLLSFSLYAPIATGSFMHSGGLPFVEYLRTSVLSVRHKLEQIFLMLAFLVSQTWVQVDAICRTIYRKTISRRKLLEWVSFAQTQQGRKKTTGFFILNEWIWDGPLFSALVFSAILLCRPSAIGIAAPFLLLWTSNPILKRWLHGKSRSPVRALGPSEITAFREYARRTWHFFETFLGPEDNWLAPDNFQIDPKPIVAHRTSPTNIGLQCLAAASAYDLGYIGLLDVVDLLERIFETIGKLKGMHGHLFNWYDTQTLEPLRPQYISTVDSGNLAGHLLALKQFCLELSHNPVASPAARQGMRDTLAILISEAALIEKSTPGAGHVSLKQMQDALTAALAENDISALIQRLSEAEDMLNALAGDEKPEPFAETRSWMTTSLKIARGLKRDENELNAQGVQDVRLRLEALMDRCDEVVEGMDFKFLFDEQRKIFVIGYNVADGRRDNSYYDLLASESRLASFVAIAKGDVPQEHWFHLGRKMTSVPGGRALIAWTATMFEYLMPNLVMRNYEGTLLNQTYLSVVARQISYGQQHGVPWGISEAGYNARDLQLNYQYGPFGIPGLGLKRGLSDDLVISPYSSMLAAMIDPWAALSNLALLRQIGAFSSYGFYESIDYTPDRLPKGQKSFILRSFMAHHQGMSLVAINNILNDSIMPRRFHSDPLVQATQLLLQERIPSAVAIARPRAEEVHSDGSQNFALVPTPRVYSDVHLSTPRTHILSNGNYSVMITSAGAGYSRCGPLAVSRWREDATRDHWGHFFYIRNRATGKLWSTGFQPTGVPATRYEVNFAEDKVEFSRQDDDIVTHTEIIVSPEDDVELRRISLTNNSEKTVELDVTSFMEAVLAKPADDSAHPSFSNLFVQTEFVQGESALLATRRRRSKNEAQIWGFHVVVTEGQTIGSVQYETDRSRFIGRGRSFSDPQMVCEDRPLSNTVGSVLDPIFSLRESVRILPGETVRVGFATGIAPSREDALRLIDKYHDIHIFAREAEIAWTKSQVQLRHLNISTDKAHVYQRLAGRVIYSDPSLRPPAHVLASNAKTQSGLWAYGISGDLPIILMRISDEKDMAMVRELLHCHEYLRLKGLVIDLVILNERSASYMLTLQEELLRQLRMSGSQALLDKPSGVFIRRADIMPPEDVLLLKAIARVELSAQKGTLDEQLKRRTIRSELPATLVATSPSRQYLVEPPILPVLTFFNGLGGFGLGGKTYVIILGEGQATPAPWINVIANDRGFGFLVSESGSGYTWSANSRENRLTSWSNDAVSDPASEAIFIRDEKTGEYWSPTPLPIREPETYVVQHGQGYTQFGHTSHGIAQELQLFVPLDAEIKLSRLRLRNLTKEIRHLSVTSFAEWVLGVQRGASAPSVITEVDPVTGAIFARNPYNNEFASRVAFADISETARTLTCDRKEFIGRNSHLGQPDALTRVGLSGRTGAGLDPCAAFQASFELAPGQEHEVVIMLGEAENAEKAREMILKYREKAHVREAYASVLKHWDEILGAIEIKTPDTAMNLLCNRWLLYQTLSCRIWARSAFYQSGGAYGFRDQLQDVMALIYAKPQVAREQILRASARQFVEGDVQHWWHPPTGRGVRTRCSDDLIWLPFVVSYYIGVTQDRTILDELTHFLEGPELAHGVDDSYTHPEMSAQSGTILEHCKRALDRSLALGAHGLPLMGSCDWNDGMSRVGHEGRGESVWVGWFLHATLEQFIPYCEAAGDTERAATYRNHQKRLKKGLEENAWDGDWYRRAYFDDGTPLGSAANSECRIDSLAQSWAVLSEAGDPQRAVRAMAAVDEHLVHRGDGLVKLFTPPFDQGTMDPGYIKGYVPGVRENGGQYTHAAIWAMMAYAKLGDGDRAGELYALLNPINHAATRAGVHKYKVEPYVMAADIYGLWPHVGRGGWTWYTGSSSWMYRAALESILGFELQGDKLRIHPKIPKHWRGFEMTYRRGKTAYLISVSRTHLAVAGQSTHTRVDGVRVDSDYIPIVDDGLEHQVVVFI